MYTQDKDEIKTSLDVLQDALDDCWAWDANHDDVLNDELGGIQKLIDEAKEKLKTL